MLAHAESSFGIKVISYVKTMEKVMHCSLSFGTLPLDGAGFTFPPSIQLQSVINMVNMDIFQQ